MATLRASLSATQCVLLILVGTAAWGQSVSGLGDAFGAGDVPRAALETLPGTRSGETHGVTYRFGLLTSAEELIRVGASIEGSRFGGFEWGSDPEMDWQRHRLVYVAFDGATRLLSLEEVRERDGGIFELVFVARPSRRRETPDGPCSLLLWRADSGTGEAIRLIERAPDGSEAELGELALNAVSLG